MPKVRHDAREKVMKAELHEWVLDDHRCGFPLGKVRFGRIPKPPRHRRALPGLLGAALLWPSSLLAGPNQSDRADAEFARKVQVLVRAPLTADRAVQIALLNNRALQATFEEIGVAKSDLIEAGLLKNPVFDASVRLPDEESSGTNTEFSLALELIDILQIPLRRKVAASEVARARLRAGDAVLKLSAEVKSAFYSLQGKQQLAARTAEINRANAASLELYQRQHEAGNISDLDLANQQASYSEARLEVAQVEVEIRSEREKLNRLLGLWGGATQWTIAERLPEPPSRALPTERLETLAIAQRLDLAASKAEIATLVQSLGLTNSYRYIPSLELGVSTERDPEGSRVTGPSIRMELPVFNQGQARVAKLQAQLRQAERRMEAEAIDIRAEVRDTRDRMLAKEELARFYRDELVPERARVLRLTLTQYNAMLKGAYDLLLARQNELAAERGYIEALRDYWIARAELERAVGGRLTGSPNRTTETFRETKTRP